MLPDVESTSDDLDVVLCPPGLRADGVRALRLAAEEAEHTLRCLERRAVELSLPVFVRRIAGLRQQLAEASADLVRNPR